MRRHRYLATAIAAAALAAPLALHPGSAEAAGARGFMSATVRGNSLEAAFASTGTVSFRRTSAGRYTLFARNLTGTGTAQLSIIDGGTNPPVCTVGSISASTRGTTLKVRCNSVATGAPADGDFNLTHSSLRDVDAAYGYLRLTTTSTATSTPSNQFRSRGTGRAKVRRYAVGGYEVTIPNETFPANTGIVMVSATGSAVRYCNAGSWGVSSPNLVVQVDCFDRFGAPANATFSLVATERNLLPSRTGGGAAWSSSFSRTASPTALGPGYAFNFEGATNTHQFGLFTGQALVVVPDVLTIVDSFVFNHVVAYNGNFRCFVDGAPLVGPPTDDVTIAVMCRTIGGAPADVSFDAFTDLVAVF